MQGRRKIRRLDHAATPARVKKKQPLVEANLRLGAGTPVEICKIRTAAERDVLTIVNFLATRKRKRRRATAQVRPFFDEANAEARFSQRDGAGKARQAAAHHQHGFG